MGIYHKKIRLVLNRYVKSKLMSLESVEKALGVKVFWTPEQLPNRRLRLSIKDFRLKSLTRDPTSPIAMRD